MKELWKIIPSETNYEVSNHGQVRRADNRRNIRPQFDVHGALQIQLSTNGVKTTYRLARLVGAAFCRYYDVRKIVDFRDGDPNNCRADNLIWRSRKKSANARKLR